MNPHYPLVAQNNSRERTQRTQRIRERDNRSGLAFATAGFRFARMKVANLEAALKARPFRPFEIRVDGEAISVRHPEQVFLAEQKTTAIIDAGDLIHIFDVAAISKIPLLRGSSSKGA